MKLFISVLAIALLPNADASAIGMGLSMVSSMMPPEMRGMTGTLANIALADANKKKGLIEFVQDGSDYGWICLCPTSAQVAYLKSHGKDVTDTHCAEDQTIGCRTAQVDMSAAPMPSTTST